jgi:hypothetical protein
MASSYPDATEIRRALISRVREFSKATGMPVSKISHKATNDTQFLFDVHRGKNFTVARYQKVQTWLDENWPDRSSE